jgi:ribosomal protein S12 methylthiotransferase accessory factor
VPLEILRSSYRTEAPDVTLRKARELAPALGITRVTDATRLDWIGLPVYMSIRPTAFPGSLCVNAGKGLSKIDAEVGAYMEAIEFALAEPGNPYVEVHLLTARDVLDGRHRPDAILDFCPGMGIQIPLDAAMECVQAEEIESGAPVYVPAELVFVPYGHDRKWSCYFGSNSNGLASGNNCEEATLHGLAEVIERDIRSFQSVNDTSALLEIGTAPAEIQAIHKSIHDAGLLLYIRHVENRFRLPFFMSTVIDPESENPIWVSGGYGCHFSASIALFRSATEAAQSRLSYIHGGRDDLLDGQKRYKDWSQERIRKHFFRQREAFGRSNPKVAFGSVPCWASSVSSISDGIELLSKRIRSIGCQHILRVCYTPPDSPLAVVRILVPTLEFFNETTVRIGRRLRDYVSAL